MLIIPKTYLVIVGFFCVLISSSFAQDQRIADSVRQMYLRKDLPDTVKFEVLRILAFNEVSDFNLALKYSNELIQLAEREDNLSYSFIGFFQKGNKKKILGDLDEALEAYVKSLSIAKELGDTSKEGDVYGAIADVYSVNGNHANAVHYYKKAIDILRHTDDSVSLASAILNAGDEYLNHRSYDSALLYFTESGMIFEKVNYPVGKAYNLGNMGMVYANMGESIQAENKINEAIQMLEKSEDFYPICFYLLSMSDIYQAQNDLPTAISYAGRSLKLARQYKLKQQISDANLKLSDLYEIAGKPIESLNYYKDHIVYRDSVNNIRTVQKLADLRTDFEVSQKQIEVDLLHEQKRNLRLIQISSVVIFGVICGGLLFQVRQKKKSNKKLSLVNEAISEMNASKDKFFSIISHDLRGPLNSLIGFSELLLNHTDALSKEEIRMLSLDVDKSLKNLSNLLENLLQWSLSQTGHLDFQPEAFDICRILNENETLLKDLAQTKKIRLVNENDSIIMVYANYNSINTVVRNLISNAIKFTPEGGVVTLSVTKADHHVTVAIHDTGLGISEKIIQKLFRIESKHSSVGTADEKGTGLGLIICKDFVEKNGGTIGVESVEKKGSTFYFTLPLPE